MLIFSIVVGLVGGVIIGGLDLWVFGPPMQAMLQDLNISLPESIRPPAWQGFLASFNGGITEEAMLRLFMLTLLAWLGSLVSHDDQRRPSLGVLWLANILAAGLFGLGHKELRLLFTHTAIAESPQRKAIMNDSKVIPNYCYTAILRWQFWI